MKPCGWDVVLPSPTALPLAAEAVAHGKYNPCCFGCCYCLPNVTNSSELGCSATALKLCAMHTVMVCQCGVHAVKAGVEDNPNADHSSYSKAHVNEPLKSEFCV